MNSTEDHFEMNFIVKFYKLAKSLVKIGKSKNPNPNFGSNAPVDSSNSAHIAHVPTWLWATWAEVPEPAGASDPRMALAIHMYPFLLSNSEIYNHFR